MKTCSRFHFGDVERGDRLALSGGSRQEFEEEPDPDVVITVRHAYRTTNFGPMIDATDGKTYYLDDYARVENVTHLSGD